MTHAQTATSPSDAGCVGETTRQSWHVLAVLSLLMGFASISTDLYLPAMPAMAARSAPARA